MTRLAVLFFSMVAAYAAAQPLERQTHRGTGVVKSVDRAAARVVLRHEPIESLRWPIMTMAFAVRDAAMLENLSPERRVEFEFVLQDGQFVITSIK